MRRIHKITAEQSYPLYDVAGTRSIEQRAQAELPEHTLMQRAGLAAAQLTLALAPHARQIWIACGPGNNGGDGFEAALQLHQLGKSVTVSWTTQAAGGPGSKPVQPADAQAARQRAMAAGLVICSEPPSEFDFGVDALLGIGGDLSVERAGTPQMAQWLRQMHSRSAPVLSLDLPSRLNADTGEQAPVRANALTLDSPQSAGMRHTLSLLTLKPGLFTAAGRDEAGQVWFADLGVALPADVQPCAWLQGADTLAASLVGRRLHASHKGSFGDVAVLGGDSGISSNVKNAAQSNPDGSRPWSGMTGAALLAARAALHAGAGRVYVALLGDATLSADVNQPELMFRSPAALDLERQVLVCGCGGGQAIRQHLPAVLERARRAIFDADALNAIAEDSTLQAQLAARQARGHATILTPHPLEAARLLKCSAAQVQSDRRRAAQTLADSLGCVVVLKGSGSLIAAPGQTPRINHSGNALLASAGTGDVLAGMIGAALAAGESPWAAASQAVFRHGQIADEWARVPQSGTLTAALLARRSGWHQAGA